MAWADSFSALFELLQMAGPVRIVQTAILGDIDEHGFHILARLRKSYPNIRSLMMDIQTLNNYCTPGIELGTGNCVNP